MIKSSHNFIYKHLLLFFKVKGKGAFNDNKVTQVILFLVVSYLKLIHKGEAIAVKSEIMDNKINRSRLMQTLKHSLNRLTIFTGYIPDFQNQTLCRKCHLSTKYVYVSEYTTIAPTLTKTFKKSYLEILFFVSIKNCNNFPNKKKM